MKSDPKNFYAVVTEAVVDILDHGADSATRIETWESRIRKAAEATLKPVADVDRMLRDGLNQIYERLIDKGGITSSHPGIPKFTINELKPELRKLLDQRIQMSAHLVKNKRSTAIASTLQRFSGWASSVPPGGTEQGKKKDIKEKIGGSLKSLTYEDRRLLTDQGHKLTASIDEVVAEGGGAIAGSWHSRWLEPGYDYREDHKERDEKIYLVRGSWADKAGLVKPKGNKGYYGDQTKVAEEPFCRCKMRWIYALRDLPPDMLTAKGKAELARVRAKLAS